MVIDDIRKILAAPDPAAPQPFLDHLDATLTDGYAQALQLEAERSRMERRMADLAAADVLGHRSDELAGLAERVTALNERIRALRALLDTLRVRRAEIRAS